VSTSAESGKGCVWYVSKYVAPPSSSDPTSVGGRGYEIMRELAAAGHDCVIITSDANHLATVPEFEGSHLVEHRDGLQVCWLRTMKSAKARSLRRIAGWLDFEWQLFRFRKRSLPPPDVVVISSLSLLTVLNGVWLQRRLGVRLVFEVRDIWPLSLIEGGYSPRNPFVRLLEAVERLGYRRADAVVGTMPNLGEHVERVLGTPKPTYCIPMGYAPRVLTRSLEQRRSPVSLPVPEDSFVVGYAGTVGTTNALEPYFRAAEAMSSEPGVHFLVLGDGDLLEDYRRRYEHLTNLSFLPKVAKPDVAAVLARCDLLYLSTFESEVWRFGQSLNKLIDYMLSGKPVLASYSGFPSMINEADCGEFLPAQNVAALVAEVRRYAAMCPEERAQIGQRGRDWILENRSFRSLAEAYEPILFPDEAAGGS
jgi:glycosyltransferase involved in cell wall biosynthesis